MADPRINSIIEKALNADSNFVSENDGWLLSDDLYDIGFWFVNDDDWRHLEISNFKTLTAFVHSRQRGNYYKLPQSVSHLVERMPPYPVLNEAESDWDWDYEEYRERHYSSRDVKF